MAGFFNKIGKKMDEFVDSTTEKLSEVKDKFDPLYELQIPKYESIFLAGTQSEICDKLQEMGLLKELKNDSED